MEGFGRGVMALMEDARVGMSDPAAVVYVCMQASVTALVVAAAIVLTQ